MNPLAQLLAQQSPALIGFVVDLLRKRHPNPEAVSPTSTEVIAAFEALFKDSAARDVFLITALEAEIAARKATEVVPAAKR